MKLNFRKGSAFASSYARKTLLTKEAKDFKNITVIRHAAIGDWVGTRPFLIELRKNFPNAKITLSVTRSYMYGMPEDLVDAVHIMDKDHPRKKGKKTSFISRIKQAKELPPQDIIFDLTDSALSLTVVFFTQSVLKVGFPYRGIKRFFYDMSILRSEFILETESLLHMLYMLGVKPTLSLDYGYAEKYPKQIDKRVVYFAGASIKSKCWEEKKFSELIQKMILKYPDYTHVILQGIKEDEKFLTLYESVKDSTCVKLQTPMALDDTMQYLANSSMVISNDTGIRNMALSVETPTIGIFFDTLPYRYWPKDGKHDFVLNPNHTSPEVSEVFKTTTKLLDTLYVNKN